MTPKKIRTWLWTCAALFLIGGIAAGLHWRNPHLANRAGALITTLAALAGVAQILFDLHVARAIQASEQEHSMQSKVLVPTPVNALALEIKRRNIERERDLVDAERLHLAVSIITTAAAGEFIHGFGDLIIHVLFELAN